MAKVTYLGEGLWPSPEIEWDGDVFPLGQAVEVDEPAKVKKASANPAFRVQLDKPEPAVAAPDPESGHAHDDEAPPRRTVFARHAPAPNRKK